MNKNKLLLFVLPVVFLASCIKQLDKSFQGTTKVEMDATVLNSNTSGLTYPVLARHPRGGYPVLSPSNTTSSTADSTIRRTSGKITLRINLVGPQSDKDQTVGYKTFDSPVTSFAFPATANSGPYMQTPAVAAATLAISTAVAGTHYTALSGKITIPAKSSFGYIDIPLIAGTATAGQGRFIGIQLDSTGTVLPNPNYNKIGLVIDLR